MLILFHLPVVIGLLWLCLRDDREKPVWTGLLAVAGLMAYALLLAAVGL
jgi:hypothetical protein